MDKANGRGGWLEKSTRRSLELLEREKDGKIAASLIMDTATSYTSVRPDGRYHGVIVDADIARRIGESGCPAMEKARKNAAKTSADPGSISFLPSSEWAIKALETIKA